MNKHLYAVLHALVAAVVVTVPITFLVTWVNVGFGQDFWPLYVRSSIIATIVSAPVSMVAVPLAHGMLRGLRAAESSPSKF